MSSTVRYVFGLIGALVASLAIYAWFLSNQPVMYNAMNNQLNYEYLKRSGNNGELSSQAREDAWTYYKDNNASKMFDAYKEG